MGIFRKYALAAVAAMGLTAGQSQAAIITSATNNPLNFSWSYTSIAGTLSGNGTMTVSGFNSPILSILVSLTNSSTDPTIRLVSFGFGIDPDAGSVSFSDAEDGGMTDATMSAIPALKLVEVCAWGGSNCAGGANGGILGGLIPNSDTFTLNLTREDPPGPGAAPDWGSSITIEPIGFKYQTGPGSFEFTTGEGCLGANAPIGFCGTTVPEPSTLPMILVSILSLMGFGYLGMSRRARA